MILRKISHFLLILLVVFKIENQIYSQLTSNCIDDPIQCYYKFGPNDFKKTSEYFSFIKTLRNLAKSNKKYDFIEYNKFLINVCNNHSQLNKYEAYPYAYELSLNTNKLKQLDTKILADAYRIIGNIQFHFRNYRSAETNLLLAINEKHTTDNIKIDCYNTLGLIENKKNNPENAINHFNKALKYAQKINHESWKGVILGNLGSSHFKLKNYEEALELLKMDYETSSKNESNFLGANHALLSMIEIYIIKNDLNSAKDKLKIINLNTDKTKSFHLDNHYMFCYYYVNSMYYKKINEHKLSLLFLENAIKKKEQADLEREKFDLEKIQFQLNFEKQTYDEAIALQIQQNKELKYTLIIFIGLTASISFLTYYIIQLKRKKAANLLLIQENERKQIELLEANSFLNKTKKGIVEKNKIIENLQAQIENYTDLNNISELKLYKLEQLDQLKSSVVLTEDDWIQFKRTFEKIYPTFIQNLIKVNSSITNSEIRLATLLKLNLSTSEIANTLGISSDSVRKTKLRMKNKLMLKKQEDLIVLLNSLK